MKTEEKLLAVKLRKAGKSYQEILKQVPVSKSTLSLWLRGVILTNEQKHRLYFTLKRQNAYRLAKKKQDKKRETTKKIIEESIIEFDSLKTDPLFLSGLMLYWAEGDKSEEIEAVKFTNSDPLMIGFMMNWFRGMCKVREEKFRISLHLHTLHCRKDVENYWSEVTQIPLNQFNKPFIKPTSLKHRKRPLYEGTCSIKIHNKNLFRKIKGWKLGFQKEFINKLAPSFNG